MSALDIFERLKDTESFGTLVEEVEGVIGPSVAAYRVELKGPTQSKAFKDAVWGMIDMQAPEVVILDSPPMQRLRRIRQLGLGFLTYPTGGYSRFEHTLGAVHQAERMLHAIIRRSNVDANTTDALEAAIPVVRLSAMLHDVGHLPLSHVGERFYSDAECPDDELLEPVKAMLEEAKLILASGIKLAEALSLAVLASPSFAELIADAGYSDEDVAVAALAIAGKPPSISRAFIAQLISNVIDADKLDYMFRDAFVTGVPPVVDIERLLFKLECLKVRFDALPTDSMRELALQGEEGILLGTDLAGDRLSYDIALSRSMLFERVYFHHKTRAAERVALSALRSLGLRPAELLVYDDNLFAQYGADKHPDEMEATVEMLLNRRLPRRAMAISYELLVEKAPTGAGDVVIMDDETGEGWEQLSLALGDAKARLALEQEIADCAGELAGHLGREDDFEVSLDTTPESPEVNDSALMVRLPDGRTVENSTLPARLAAFTYNPLAIAHVFASGGPDAERFVFIAAETVIERKYKVHFGEHAANYAKVRWDKIEEMKRQLEAARPDFFAAQGKLRPLTKLRNGALARERVAKLAERFSHYNAIEKPDNEAEDFETNVNEERIFRFLDQFPERLAEPMLAALERLQFLDRSELGRDLAAALADGAPGGALCAPLTDRVGKSAEHLGKYLRDSDRKLQLKSLREVLAGEGPVTFYDDLTISGKQARTVVQTWAGLEPDLQEDLADALTMEEVAQLRERGVRFRFAYARPDGIKALEEATAEAGLGSDVEAVILDELGAPLDGSDESESADLRAFLHGVGRELLLSSKHVEEPEKWTEELCEQRALGYSLAERLVVLAYNTPTSTVTALWKSGAYRNAPWLPLFPRSGESLPDATARERGLPLIEQ